MEPSAHLSKGIKPADGSGSQPIVVRQRRRRRGSTIVSLVLAAVLGGGVASVWWASSFPSPEELAAAAEPPPPAILTVPVEFRDLESTITLRGDVFATDVATVESFSGGVITRVLVTAGDAVEAGDVVIEVSGRPVFIFEGAFPIYRDLAPGVQGDDVAQLQAGLKSLGLEIDDESGVYGASTGQAVLALYDTVGYEPLPAPDVTPDDLKSAEFALETARIAVDAAKTALKLGSQGPPAAELAEAQAIVDAAKRNVDLAEATEAANRAIADVVVENAQAAYDRVQADPASTLEQVDAARLALVEAQQAREIQANADAAAVAGARDDLVVALARLDDLSEPVDSSSLAAALKTARLEESRAEETLSLLASKTGPTVGLNEIRFVADLPAIVAHVHVAASDVDDGELLTLSSESLEVRVPLSKATESMVQEGSEATIEDDEGNVMPARVSGVQVATTPVGGEETNSATPGSTGYEAVVVGVETIPSSLRGRNVRVNILISGTETPQMAVPMSAVFPQEDGSSSVAVLADDGKVTTVPVTLGESAGGFVAVSNTDGALERGDRVIVSQ